MITPYFVSDLTPPQSEPATFTEMAQMARAWAPMLQECFVCMQSGRPLAIRLFSGQMIDERPAMFVEVPRAEHKGMFAAQLAVLDHPAAGPVRSLAEGFNRLQRHDQVQFRVLNQG